MSWKRSYEDTEWSGWETARTVHDLGRLTALWLTGALPSQPGYMPNYGPDPETEPLIPVLAAANRVGYLTDASQPGCSPSVGYDGAIWTQRAAVSGWMHPDTADELADTAIDAGLIVITHTVRPHRWSRRDRGWVDVTRRAGRAVTGFGAQRTAADLRFQYQECPAATAALLTATQLTLAAPGYGPDERVWHVLAEWSGQSTGRVKPESVTTELRYFNVQEGDA
jgi:hypothetical protein